MSAIIYSRIVDLEELIPRPLDIEREEKDIEGLVPWVFRHTENASKINIYDWEDEDDRFSEFFEYLCPYRSEVEAWARNEGSDAADLGVSSALRASQKIALPRKNWDVSENRRSGPLIYTQGTMLKLLMRDIYSNLEGIRNRAAPFHSTVIRPKLRYVIGGKQYAAKPEGGVIIGPMAESLPIISFTGWFEGQTWSQFLEETLSIMLGQLTRNINIQSNTLNDQEVFVIGFHGAYIHVARGFFTASLISRVHSQGCSEDESFDLKFTRGYNLCLKEDWLEATRALARLLRHLRSGNARVGGVQTSF